MEHMLFRGTARYASLEIDQIFDAMGAEINAGTGKETTSVYSRVLDVHVERASTSWPTWSGGRGSPTRTSTTSARSSSRRSRCTRTTRRTRSSTCSARPSSATIRWAGRSSARAEVVAGRRQPSCRDFHARALRAAATSSSPPLARSTTTARRAGREDDGEAGAAGAPPAPLAAARRDRARRRFSPRRPSSTTSLSARPASPATTSGASRCACWTTILGGTSSSRLFQEVREQRGLAYSVYSFTGVLRGTGQIGLYLGTRPDNVGTRAAGRRRRAGQAAGRRRHRRGAGPLEGERQGPHRAVAGVDDVADEPPRLVGAGRHAAADRRRDRRAHRRRDAGRPRRAGARAVRARAAQRGRHRRRRGRVPRRAGAGPPALAEAA